MKACLSAAKANGTTALIDTNLLTRIETLLDTIEQLEDSSSSSIASWPISAEIQFTFEETGERVRIGAPDNRSFHILGGLARSHPETLALILGRAPRSSTPDAEAKRGAERERVRRRQFRDRLGDPVSSF